VSKNPQDKQGSVKQLPDTAPKAPEAGRRLFILKAAAVLGVAATALGSSKKALARDPGAGHQDGKGEHHVYDEAPGRHRKQGKAHGGGGGGGKKHRKKHSDGH
jgi:hypothetical protein